MPFTEDARKSSENSTTDTLGAGGVYTGTFEEVTRFSIFNLIAYSDVDSAADGIELQWSMNGSTVHRVEKTKLIGNVNQGRAFTLAHRGPYFRLKYTNGAQAQTVFSLGIVNRFEGTGVITKPLKGSVDDENFAQLVQAATTRRHPDGTFSHDPAEAQRKGFAYTTAQTDTALWTPASGKRVMVTGYIITATGTTDADMQMFFNTNSANNWVYNGRIDVSANSPVMGSMTMNPPTGGAIDEILKVTTNAAMTVAGVVFGYEK